VVKSFEYRPINKVCSLIYASAKEKWQSKFHWRTTKAARSIVAVGNAIESGWQYNTIDWYHKIQRKM
jgi:hypothetical protein